MEFNINVNVKIDGTDRLRGIVDSICGALRGYRDAAPHVDVYETTELTTEPVTDPAPLPAAELPAAEVPEPMPLDIAPEPEPATVEYTDDYLLDAIKDVRARIEGTDWETNPDSQGRKMYHKKLTQYIKNLSSQCAVSVSNDTNIKVTKPTELPIECRAAFVRELAEITIDPKTGEITQTLPF